MLSLDLPQSPVSSDLMQTHRILIVEDEEIIREMLVLALKEEGYEVIAASHGRAALDLLQVTQEAGDNPVFDLLILDLMLPQVNGLDICRLLRYHGNLIPILILKHVDHLRNESQGVKHQKLLLFSHVWHRICF